MSGAIAGAMVETPRTGGDVGDAEPAIGVLGRLELAVDDALDSVVPVAVGSVKAVRVVVTGAVNDGEGGRMSGIGWLTPPEVICSLGLAKLCQLNVTGCGVAVTSSIVKPSAATSRI